jgi:hypothetical protein
MIGPGERGRRDGVDAENYVSSLGTIHQFLTHWAFDVPSD